jgi:hypothetical protein
VPPLLFLPLARGIHQEQQPQNDILRRSFYRLRLQDKSRQGASFGPGQLTVPQEQVAFQNFLLMNRAMGRPTPLQPYDQTQLPYSDQMPDQLMLPAPVQKPARFADWLWAGFKSKKTRR